MVANSYCLYMAFSRFVATQFSCWTHNCGGEGEKADWSSSMTAVTKCTDSFGTDRDKVFIWSQHCKIPLPKVRCTATSEVLVGLCLASDAHVAFTDLSVPFFHLLEASTMIYLLQTSLQIETRKEPFIALWTFQCVYNTSFKQMYLVQKITSCKFCIRYAIKIWLLVYSHPTNSCHYKQRTLDNQLQVIRHHRLEVVLHSIHLITLPWFVFQVFLKHAFISHAYSIQ